MSQHIIYLNHISNRSKFKQQDIYRKHFLVELILLIWLKRYYLYGEKDKKNPESKTFGICAISIVLIKYSEFSKHL